MTCRSRTPFEASAPASENFVDQIFAQTHACAHFHGAPEARAQKAIECAEQAVLLQHYPAAGGLLSGVGLRGYASVGLSLSLPHGVNRLQELPHLDLPGLDGHGDFPQVQEPFARIGVASLRGSLQLGRKPLQLLGNLLSLELRLLVLLIDCLNIHEITE